jgi:hypothetical protein
MHSGRKFKNSSHSRPRLPKISLVKRIPLFGSKVTMLPPEWGTIGAKLGVKKEKVLIRTNVYGVSGKQKPRIL